VCFNRPAHTTFACLPLPRFPTQTGPLLWNGRPVTPRVPLPSSLYPFPSLTARGGVLLRCRVSHPYWVPVRYPTRRPTAPAFLSGWTSLPWRNNTLQTLMDRDPSRPIATFLPFVSRSRPEDIPLLLSQPRSLQSRSSHGKISVIATFTLNIILPDGTLFWDSLYPRVALFVYL